MKNEKLCGMKPIPPESRQLFHSLKLKMGIKVITSPLNPIVRQIGRITLDN
jgi:hypothetical protein